MKRFLIIGLVIVAALLYIKSQTIAADPPHSSAQGVYCNSCHSVHNASGTSLTSDASNANLCLSCHTSGGLANAKRLNTSMQAVPGTSGTSHRWDKTMPVTNNGNNAYGLRWTTSITNPALQQKLIAYGNVVTCSVCHNQHGQAATPWDAFAPNYAGQGTGWATTGGRNFQRMSNNGNQMCEDCHYYRSPNWVTNVRTWNTNQLSHPVMKIFTTVAGRNVTDPTQFNGAPLEPSASGWAWQTGSRHQLNGGTDTNLTNNIVVDSSMQIRCLSCHGMHYTDSSSGSVDGP